MFIPQNTSWCLFLTHLHRIQFNFFFSFSVLPNVDLLCNMYSKPSSKGTMHIADLTSQTALHASLRRLIRCKSVCWVKSGMDPRAFFSHVNLYFAKNLKYNVWRYSLKDGLTYNPMTKWLHLFEAVATNKKDKPWLKKIIWLIGVLRRAVVSDWRFDNLCGSHLQSQVAVLVENSKTLVSDLIGQ